MNIEYNKLAKYLNNELTGETISYKSYGIQKYIKSGKITEITSSSYYYHNFNIYIDNIKSFYFVGEDYKIYSYGVILHEKFLEKINLHVKEFMFKEYGVVII